MALFKVDQARAAYPSCIIIHGSFVVPASPAYNLQILPVAQTLTTAGTTAAQVSTSINPAGIKVNVFCNPFLGQPLPATNTARLPAALPSGGVTPLGSEYLIDLSGFPADIACVQMDICRQSRNAIQAIAQASYIDTVNKYLIAQMGTVASGAAVAPSAGSLISFQVTMKDSIGI